jgi:hypothetical protein
MTWYAAHLVLFFRLKRRRPSRFLVWENIVLLKAKSLEEAFAKAEERGRQDAGAGDESLHLDDEPAELVFAGVRKLVACQDETKRPTDGTEISYTEMELRSEEDIRKLVAGKPVSAAIVDVADEASAEARPDELRRLRKPCREL